MSYGWKEFRTVSNILAYSTALSNSFNSAGYGVVKRIASNKFNLTQNSPQTASNTSYQVLDSFFANWEFRSIYSVTVSKNAFGASGFGGVKVPSVYNSAYKVGLATATLEPGNAVVQNQVLAQASVLPAQSVTASALASVQVLAVLPGDVVAGPLVISGKTVSFTLTNNGGASVDIDSIFAQWPTVNGKLNSIKLGSISIYGTAVNGPSATITAFSGSLTTRTLAPGQTATLLFTFANNVSTLAANYLFKVDFGDGIFVQK